jgi:hypothetical protein
LAVYVPVRYHHRPGGVDDAYGLSKPSRFLTDHVQCLFTVTRTREPVIEVRRAGAGEAGGGRAGTRGAGEGGGEPRRIEVSVDSLFG